MSNERKQMEAEIERQELLRTIAENKILEQEKTEKNWNKNRTYQDDLVGQIKYNNQLRDLELRRDEEEFVLGMHAEREYQTRLKDCLDSPEYDKLHPMRRAMAARSAQQPST